MAGEPDIAGVGALVADPSRARILLALGDGRALPAGRLAAEAGVSPATTSSHLARLARAGFLAVEPHGRNRYYRLSRPEVAELIESMQRLAPVEPVRSLREGTRAHALRAARTCYDHLAGRLGVELMAYLIAEGHLAGGDGTYDPAGSDDRAGFGHDVVYTVTASGHRFFDHFGVRVPAGRPAVRYCVDWSEQRHHLSGGLGRGLCDRLFELGWIRRTDVPRAVQVTDLGRDQLAGRFAVAAY